MVHGGVMSAESDPVPHAFLRGGRVTKEQRWVYKQASCCHHPYKDKLVSCFPLILFCFFFCFLNYSLIPFNFAARSSSACARLTISPLAITGIDTFSFTLKRVSISTNKKKKYKMRWRRSYQFDRFNIDRHT